MRILSADTEGRICDWYIGEMNVPEKTRETKINLTCEDKGFIGSEQG